MPLISNVALYECLWPQHDKVPRVAHRTGYHGVCLIKSVWKSDNEFGALCELAALNANATLGSPTV